jgi:hypothetical protein
MLIHRLKQTLKRTVKTILQEARESAIKFDVEKQSFSTLAAKGRS